MTKDIKKETTGVGKDLSLCGVLFENDPVQFPHRYRQKQDIEISGLLTAIMSFGNRKQILKKADELHDWYGGVVLINMYLSRRLGEGLFLLRKNVASTGCFRMPIFILTLNAVCCLFPFESLEEALQVYSGLPIEKLCAFLEVSSAVLRRS